MGAWPLSNLKETGTVDWWKFVDRKLEIVEGYITSATRNYLYNIGEDRSKGIFMETAILDGNRFGDNFTMVWVGCNMGTRHGIAIDITAALHRFGESHDDGFTHAVAGHWKTDDLISYDYYY